MSHQTNNLVQLVQARGVPVVLLERVDTELGRKRKFSSVEPDSPNESDSSKFYRFNILKPGDTKIFRETDDDVDSGIEGCSSVRSSIQGVTTPSIDDALSHEESTLSDEDLFSAPQKNSKEPLNNGEYSVQKVMLHKYNPEGGHLFFIKWHGWGHEHNTWEPLKHLHCPELLTDFFKQLILDALKGKVTVPYCPPYNNRAYREILRMWIDSVSTHRIVSSMRNNPKGRPIAVAKLIDMIQQAVHLGNPSKSGRLIEDVKANCVLWKRYHSRRAQKEKLKAWEDRINTIGPGGITVENDVDLEVPPENFKFVNECVMGEGVDPPQPAIVGCECVNCDRTQERCCPDLANAEFAYNRAQLFVLDRGYAIYECNSLCKCGSDCSNRVVQKGRQARLCIFRTNNGRGWGVKALQFIRKGSFISAYIGEVLTVEEADRRSEEYEKDGLAYLFDLDYTYDDDCAYSVDATYVGNESHFINHSCDPNSYVIGVYNENLDPKMPLLALFASRNIYRGEEITFNYNGNSSERTPDAEGHEQYLLMYQIAKITATAEKLRTILADDNWDDEDPSSPRNLKWTIACKCGSRNCSKYLFKSRMSNQSADDSIIVS